MSPITMKRTLVIVLAGAFLALAGCSTPNQQTSGFNTTTGKHTETWYTDHRAAFLQNPQGCSECHGADFRGGISVVSCFSSNFSGLTCHANGPSNHPANWPSPAIHGAAAKAAPDPATMSGFSTCQICHGTDFSGGFIQTIVCSACHGGSAPHPVSWMTATGTYTHTTTNAGNAAVCAQCHRNGNNSPIAKPSPPAPAGTAPGCFNATLCHGAAGHPAGWSLPAAHGASAKAAPNAATMSGFSTCQPCHGTLFTGGVSNTVCSDCHGGSAPHPISWATATGTYTHSTTNTGNAPVCALCHQSAAGTPGCFNNTLCHGAMGHPAGWADPAQHGAKAKLAPNAATPAGFSVCQTCHGDLFTGGISGQTCLNTVGCHGSGVQSPHPSQWSPDSPYKHNTTNEANAPVCFLCHQTGGAGTPGCFNDTLCHGPK